MCSDSESAGGSSESRSMDSPTASPGRKIWNETSWEERKRKLDFDTQIKTKKRWTHYVFSFYYKLFSSTSSLHTRHTLLIYLVHFPLQLKLLVTLCKVIQHQMHTCRAPWLICSRYCPGKMFFYAYSPSLSESLCRNSRLPYVQETSNDGCRGLPPPGPCPLLMTSMKESHHHPQITVSWCTCVTVLCALFSGMLMCIPTLGLCIIIYVTGDSRKAGWTR